MSAQRRPRQRGMSVYTKVLFVLVYISPRTVMGHKVMGHKNTEKNICERIAFFIDYKIMACHWHIHAIRI